MQLQPKDYIPLIKTALREDLNRIGDVTTRAIFTQKQNSCFILNAKDNGILCGRDVFTAVFKILDPGAEVEFYFLDRDPLKYGDIVARVRSSIQTILKGERVALNLISHLSGIASKTQLFVQAAGKQFKILDTRKTIPGLRILHKYAVNCGGGENHRMGLFDMVLIKDNHIDAAGGITLAVRCIKDKWKTRFKIEVETRNIAEVNEALSCGVDRIMLDNMDAAIIKEAVKIINRQAEVEVSGNITLDKIKSLLGTGIDYVSIGDLTHTIKVFDFSLKKEKT